MPIKPQTIFIIYCILFPLGCEKKTETKVVAYRQTEIKFSVVEEQAKEGWMQLEIFMDFNPSNPVHPIGVANNLKTEKLRLTLKELRTNLSEGKYYARFNYFPSDETNLNQLHMEDFIWSPSIGFKTIKLQNSLTASQEK